MDTKRPRWSTRRCGRSAADGAWSSCRRGRSNEWHEPPAEAQAYEERLLCLLLMLRDPGLRLVYVTSSPVAPAIVGYYLSLLPEARAPGRPRPADAALRRRPVGAAADREAARTPAPADPDPLVRSGDREHAVLLPYMTTALERALRCALDMPLYGADPRHLHHGTKSGGRALFARAGVPHPLGVGRITSAPRRDRGDRAAARGAAGPRRGRRQARRRGLRRGQRRRRPPRAARPGADGELRRIAERLARMTLEAGGVRVDALPGRARAPRRRDRGADHRPRACAARASSSEISPPAPSRSSRRTTRSSAAERRATSAAASRPAAVRRDDHRPRAEDRRAALADDGVIGRSAVDFVVVRDHGGALAAVRDRDQPPRPAGRPIRFAALALLTGGGYDADAATFTTAAGVAKHYVATDDLEAPSLRPSAAMGCSRFASAPAGLRPRAPAAASCSTC